MKDFTMVGDNCKDGQHDVVAIPLGDDESPEERRLLTRQRLYTMATAANSEPSTLALEWTDSFYDDDDDDAIGFDIDYDYQVAILRGSKWFVLLAISIAVIFTFVSDPSPDEFFYGCCSLVFLCILFFGMWYRESAEEARLRGVHIALTRRGVRIDVVDVATLVTTTTSIPFQRIKNITFRPALMEEFYRIKAKDDTAGNRKLGGPRGTVVIQLLDERKTKAVELEYLVDVDGFVAVLRDQVRKSRSVAQL